MQNSTCKTCNFFVQHYYKRNNRFFILYCGHCIYPRIKNRNPDTPSCNYYKHKNK